MRAAVLLVLLAAGCSVPTSRVGRTDAPLSDCAKAPPYAFFPAVGFPDSERDVMTAQMARWNAVTKPDHQLGWSEYGHLRALPLVPDEEIYNGQYRADLGIMWVRPGQPVAPVSLHEFGHAIGLHHIATPGTVMCSWQLDTGTNPVECGPPPPELTPADIAECRRVGACP